jgi:tungstate transport system substrate-binding protein
MEVPMRRAVSILLFLCLTALPVAGRADPSGFLLMASTIGPIDSGIVTALEDGFEKETGIRVRHVGAGTGAALDMAKRGGIDLVLVHARSLEEKFVQDGFGTERIDLMYNDFVIVGPPEDPAGIRGMKTAAEALARISRKGAPFITRGDKSGTHVAEMELWQKAGIKPSGPWYMVYEKGSEGNLPTLRYTDQRGAYTEIKLAVLVEKDEALINCISLIPVNPAKFPRVHHDEAMLFVKWLTSPEKGQALIRDFGKEKYGGPLFFRNSREWKAVRNGKGN